MPREITDHIVPGSLLNESLKIEVMDEPGAGGASHHYNIKRYWNHPDRSACVDACDIVFQDGPPQKMINGISGEALIAIEIDRLRCFQKGPYACDENARALMFLEIALEWLHKRTRERQGRNVEGTHQK